MTRFQKAIKYIESKGGRMLSSSVHWDNGNFNWICENNHENSSKFQMLTRKSWCKQCTQDHTKNKTIESLQEGFKLKVYSSSSCQIECPVCHITNMSASHIIEGNGCGVCHKARLKEGMSRLSIEEISRRLEVYGFTYLDSTFKSLRTPHNIKCSSGHIFKKQVQHLINGTVGCPECNNYFKSEIKFRSRLEKIFKVNFPKCRPSWLVNPKTGRRLELDCYNEELKLAFEYDGQFHFEVRKGLNNDLNKTRELDKLKEELCKTHGISLIRVPYFAKDEDFYNLIIDGMKMVYGEKYWMILRELDSGVACPQEVKDARAAARAAIVR